MSDDPLKSLLPEPVWRQLEIVRGAARITTVLRMNHRLEDLVRAAYEAGRQDGYELGREASGTEQEGTNE